MTAGVGGVRSLMHAWHLREGAGPAHLCDCFLVLGDIVDFCYIFWPCLFFSPGCGYCFRKEPSLFIQFRLLGFDLLVVIVLIVLCFPDCTGDLKECSRRAVCLSFGAGVLAIARAVLILHQPTILLMPQVLARVLVAPTLRCSPSWLCLALSPCWHPGREPV